MELKPPFEKTKTIIRLWTNSYKGDLHAMEKEFIESFENIDKNDIAEKLRMACSENRALTNSDFVSSCERSTVHKARYESDSAAFSLDSSSSRMASTDRVLPIEDHTRGIQGLVINRQNINYELAKTQSYENAINTGDEGIDIYLLSFFHLIMCHHFYFYFY